MTTINPVVSPYLATAIESRRETRERIEREITEFLIDGGFIKPFDTTGGLIDENGAEQK